MGNQGKIVKNQSGKRYVFLHISAPSLIFEKILLFVNRETSFLRLLAFLSRLSEALAVLSEYRRCYFCGLSG